MFGVLVVSLPNGALEVLKAFSGMLQSRWLVEGFCPPIFDAEARARIETPGELRVKRLGAWIDALERSEERRRLDAALHATVQRHDEARRAMEALHRRRRDRRHERRAEVEIERKQRCFASAATPEDRPRSTTSASTLHGGARVAGAHDADLLALDDESRFDKRERRALLAQQHYERATLERARARFDRRLHALQRFRARVCRRLMAGLHDTYVVPNALGERAPLRALYPSGAPPSGAGDCAAPKLLARAYALGARPVALAEFWWGATPVTGARVAGAFYPACTPKCGPLLKFMLKGLDVAPSRRFVPPRVDALLSIVFEDDDVLIVDKPAGLLSVPGREPALRDCVITRLERHLGDTCTPLVVHRLDMDTSGLLIVAKNVESHRALQQQFLRREVETRYVAWLDGRLAGTEGRIELPLRVDLDDRPRQIVDPIFGKSSITRWKVIALTEHRTRVAFFPETGRTHQLRVHASHPLGLGTAIVGDRLYGREENRLMLHAEALRFVHPKTGAEVSVERAAPF
jgi:tRNA pseudouridine32 synthase/23S rRNA pseudouridine746 synthase